MTCRGVRFWPHLWDDVMPVDVCPGERLDDGDHRHGEHGADGAEDRCPGEDRAEPHRGMDFESVPTQSWRDDVVLDLLVDDDEGNHQDRCTYVLGQRDENRQERCNEGADRGDELRNHPDPEPEGYCAG